MPVAWMVLCHIYLQTGEWPQAEQACWQALKLAPRLFQSRLQLIEVLGKQWRVAEAEQHARSLVADMPEYADGWKLLGMVLALRAEHEESLAALRHALDLQHNPVMHSKLLAGLQYAEGVEPESLLRAHEDWAIAYELPHVGRMPPPIHWPTGGRKLRLGFVSADFSQHPVGFLALPLLEALDKSACSVICYSDGPAQDSFTARFQAAADEWRPTFGTADEPLAEQVASDQIDVLFDLNGHFGNRLTTFARKLAPLQITWLGYVGTTGLSAMNYLLADQYHVRQGEERWYAETILRLPHGYACYGPPSYAPPVAPLPALTSGQVTFGCFNNPAKYSPGVLDAWATILMRIPKARLLLKYIWKNENDLRDWLHREFLRRGVSTERILVEGKSTHFETMASYGHVDIALDTQPYSGGLTTCEALWMGVPVITLPGKTFAGRHSVSHLTNAGYPQFIANDNEDYVQLAIRWANQLEELSAIRAQMREQVRLSPLCDAPRFAADFLHVVGQAYELHRPKR